MYQFRRSASLSTGFVDGLTAAQLVPHAVIHVIPRRVGDRVALPECGESIKDKGVLPR
jgi:diadenosine tetraphosphate (Ap4A) HIT family hydrolase